MNQGGCACKGEYYEFDVLLSHWFKDHTFPVNTDLRKSLVKNLSGQADGRNSLKPIKEL